ncbi:MAG: class I SAM-dependent methyltransferase [Dehalococcoidia bacterium]|jgi:predicted O-methyltransferase YrrM
MKADLESALLRANETGTMLNETQLCFLYALASMAPDGPAVECGVYKGGSLAVWSAAREDRGAIYAVDSWEPPHWSKFQAEFDRVMAAFDIPVIKLVLDSWAAPGHIKDDIAFCFIDAFHGDPGFPLDLAAWAPRIKPGGVLVFHDYFENSNKPTVTVKWHVDRWQQSAQWYELGVVSGTAAFMRPRAVAIGGRK